MALVLPARPVTLRRPIRQRVFKPRADMNQAIQLTGKYIGLFVLFTSTMNWWYYKRTREDAEKRK